MRGYISILLEFLLVVAIILGAYFFFSLKITSFKKETLDLLAKENKYLSSNSLLFTLLSTKSPTSNKTLYELISEILFYNDFSSYSLDYGYTKENLSEQVYFLLNSYFNREWRLEVKYKNKKISFGYAVPSKNVYSTPIVFPNKKTGKLYLYLK